MSKDGGITISADSLAALISRIFIAVGLSARAAETVSAALIAADLEGLSSHGVMLLDMYIDRIRNGSVSTDETGVVVSDRNGTVVLDARNVLGHLTGDQAITLAVERARRFGVGIVAVRRGFHFGTARRFALQAAEAGCVGIVACNTRPLMPAPGGAERVVGNNPLAIAFPTDGDIPIVLDMATSEAAMGKIRMADKSGASIPANWAAKADGSPTTNPAEAIAGMLLPSGGAKGFGLAFLIDLMCGLLSGGAIGSAVQPLYGDPSRPYDCAHLFVAIDVDHFGDVAAMRHAAAMAAKHIRDGKRASGVSQLFTPGEPEWRNRQKSGGRVHLAPAVVAMVKRIAGECAISLDGTELAMESSMQEPGHA
jgi:LDH2 family malate/lactate/ureidoglycolate dehydrogenase